MNIIIHVMKNVNFSINQNIYQDIISENLTEINDIEDSEKDIEEYNMENTENITEINNIQSETYIEEYENEITEIL